MDRRKFFTTIADNLAHSAVKIADDYVQKRARNWIRPPYALNELEFLLACTRCDKCIDACPHKVIFRLPARLGAQVVGTPAMDLLHKGCHLCDDWPCVNACEPGALKFFEEGEDHKIPLPKLAYAEIDTQRCLPYNGPECGACEPVCPVPGALKMDLTRPFIDPEVCTGCALCREACVVEDKAIHIHTIHTDDSSDNQDTECV